MHTIHIFTEKEVQQDLKEALRENAAGQSFELFPIYDFLHLGFLKQEDTSYAEGRNQFLAKISESAFLYDDLERLMQLSTRLSNKKDLEICYWMGDNARDICTYYWLLHYLKKHAGRLSVINFAGLPFLKEDQQLFYPNRLSELPLKELKKANKLKRKISVSEWESEQDEWQRLTKENTAIRILGANRKIESVSETFYDKKLQQLCSESPQRLSFWIKATIKEYNNDIDEPLLLFRLKALEKSGEIIFDQNKISLPQATETIADQPETNH